MPRAILRVPQVLAKTGVSRATHYNRINEGVMTQGVSLGPRARGWPEDEIDTLNSARIAGMTNEEIRDIVRKLEAARATALAPVFDAHIVAAIPAASDVLVDRTNAAVQDSKAKHKTAAKAKA